MKRLFDERTLLVIILITAALMRFWNLGSWSYTHDELGALVRLNFHSFSDLIREGVQNQDTHPAFVQVFLYVWTTVFGLSEWAVRTPFAIAGVLSVYLVFLIGKKWFGSTPALISSGLMAVLSFPILYSQLARPYSIGLLFSLWAVWCWSEFFFGNNKNLYRKAALYGIATLLCMLTHYFSFFFAMLVAASGFIYVNRQNLAPYISSGIIAVILFAPHIPISLHQFDMGGVGQWLAKPGNDFLWLYIMYGFNESAFVLLIAVGTAVAGILYYHLRLHLTTLHLLSLAWFLVPFIAGFLYSIFVNPVIQYSTLLFSFPFIILFAFSFIGEDHIKVNRILFSLIILLTAGNTIWGQRFYSKEQFGVFEEINDVVVEQLNKYGKEKTNIVLNTSTAEIFDFYFKQQSQEVPFDFIAGDDSSAVKWMMDHVDKCDKPYIIYGWSNFLSPFEFTELIKRKFPCVLYDQIHFNSRVTVFGRNNSCSRDTLFYHYSGFEANNDAIYVKKHVDTSAAFSGSRCLRVEDKDEFAITVRAKLKNVLPGKYSCVNVSARVKTDAAFNAQLVMDIGGSSDPAEWQAKYLYKQVQPNGKWQEVFATFQVPSSAYPDDELRLFLWNLNGNKFLLDDFTVSAFTDSDYDHFKEKYR